MQKNLSLILAVCSLGLAALSSIGCAGHHHDAPSAARDDITEYRQLTTESRQAMDRILAVLDQVADSGTAYSPALAKSFGVEVENIDVGSLGLRAHAHALVKRGDSYFDTWWQLTAGTKDAEAQKQAGEQRALMLADFHRIATLSTQAADAFELFLSELQTLKSDLQQNAAAITTQPVRDLIGKTQADGHQVSRLLDLIQNESDNLAAQAKSIH